MVLPSFVTVLLSSSAVLPAFWRYPFDDPNMLTTPATYQLQTLWHASTQDISSLWAHHVSLIIEDNLTLDEYTSIQPTHSQRIAWRNVVTSLLNIAVDDADGNSDCSSVRETIPDVLQGIYTVEEVDNGRFCALVEVGTVRREDREEFAKGWGIFVVPTKRAVNGVTGTTLHLSAPHPIYDQHTAGQAAHVFEQTGAKSLYIPGRSRRSFLEQTDCIVDSETKYWKTDPAHDKGEMMFDTYRAIVDWQKDLRGGGGYLDTSCAYVQFHGKGKRTCRTEQIFLSAGLGRDPKSRSWYTEPSHGHLPIHRLFVSLKKHFPSLSVTIPASPHSTCHLTATKNIVGRLINGVPEDRVCMESATAEGASGFFVHIEQDIKSRKKEAWSTWVEVFLDAFEGTQLM
ncbi:hypothetical protein AX14_008682 [Amanita brunnescens Koide BX004]|nr:hypothetical protein AX14_009197 [Amanita brunnescens Koide BX004]KAF8724699.1 hypothetical protein AX14_008682 [Amanita brunnescens Koide BX004]